MCDSTYDIIDKDIILITLSSFNLSHEWKNNNHLKIVFVLISPTEIF